MRAQGFGVRLVALHWHAAFEKGFRMAGIDISPSGIRLTQEACADRRISFEGQVSDMTTLPWADGIFDAALSISTIHHHQRPVACRPGPRLFQNDAWDDNAPLFLPGLR
jgi:ubiquinone/menaquinone biosynthesis C-methylase UbiE